MKTLEQKPELIEKHIGRFDSLRVSIIRYKITKLFNSYTEENDLSTILVVVQFRDGSQKQYWAEIPRINSSNITHIVLYRVKQTPVLIKV